MNIKYLIATAAVAVVQLLAVPNAAAIEDVTLCGNCSTQASFENAAANHVEDRRGEHMILVVNPDTKASKWVHVIHVPAGEVPMSMEQPVRVERATVIEVPVGDGGIRNVGQVEMKAAKGTIQTMGAPITSRLGIQALERRRRLAP